MPKKFKPVVKDTVLYVQGRLSYANLLEPRASEGSDEKFYSCVVLIDKNDTDSIKAIEAATDAAIKKGVVTKWGGKTPRKIEKPLRDGDEKEAEEFHGKYYFNCKSRRPVHVVNLKNQVILDANEVYSGMWGIVNINMFPYAASGNNGVGAGLNAVMKTADDEPFSGGNALHAFDDIDVSGFGGNDNIDEDELDDI